MGRVNWQKQEVRERIVNQVRVFRSFKLRLNLEPGQLGVGITGFAEILSFYTLSTKDSTLGSGSSKLSSSVVDPDL